MMSLSWRSRLAWLLTGGLLVGLGVAIGWALRPQPVWQLPVSPLWAEATDSTENFVVATGHLSDESEGVFILDGLTGDLQCTAYNPTARGFNVLFVRNVAADMQLEATKRPRYLMVAAQLRSARRLGPATGTGIIYVVEANSGKFAAYGVPWRHDLFVSGRPQQGELILLQIGSARTAPVRE